MNSAILQQFAKYQVVITDRYHGTIFSQIVNTPVIVISSTDHKLRSGVK
ncbi:polysaccharide pyruvyl transferase family protein [Prevotella pectinovora]|nr:polysaccharide pyruvyl transferase family protein [Prevotella pectinovora]